MPVSSSLILEMLSRFISTFLHISQIKIIRKPIFNQKFIYFVQKIIYKGFFFPVQQLQFNTNMAKSPEGEQ